MNWPWLPMISIIFNWPLSKSTFTGLLSKSNSIAPWPEIHFYCPFGRNHPLCQLLELFLLFKISTEKTFIHLVSKIYLWLTWATLFSNTSWAGYSQLSFELNIFYKVFQLSTFSFTYYHSINVSLTKRRFIVNTSPLHFDAWGYQRSNLMRKLKLFFDTNRICVSWILAPIFFVRNELMKLISWKRLRRIWP